MASASFKFGGIVKKKYLQYFLADRAIVTVYKRLFCIKNNKTYGELNLEELCDFDHNSFIDYLTDSEVLEAYQLHHGEYQSPEYIAAGVLFEEKARCSFHVDLASTVQQMLHKKIDNPIEKITAATSWANENEAGEIEHPQKFSSTKIQAGPKLVVKDEDITDEEFENSQISETEINEIQACLESRKDDESFNEMWLREKKMKEVIDSKDLNIDYCDEKPTFTRPKRAFSEYDADCIELCKIDAAVCIYSPPHSGKSTYVNGRYGYLFDTDELFHTPLTDKVKQLAVNGIITNRPEMGKCARKSIAIVSSKRKFIERCLRRNL